MADLTLDSPSNSHGPVSPLAAQWPVIVGLLVLFGPTYWLLARGFWGIDVYAHGPIVLSVVAWFIYTKRHAFSYSPKRSDVVAGIPLLAFGLLLFVFARSQDIVNIEVASQIPIFIAVLLLLFGTAAVKTLWFPLLFLVFLVPIPTAFIDLLTGPLKHYVSVVVDQLLYTAGYPIARTGVMLTIGQYQVLIADACSGLNSIYTLSAMGLLYTYMVQRGAWLHIAILLAGIVPIAFAANVIRVIALILVTYYFGNDAGQGFFHGFAGMFLFMIALAGFIGLDFLLGALWFSRRKKIA